MAHRDANSVKSKRVAKGLKRPEALEARGSWIYFLKVAEVCTLFRFSFPSTTTF